MAEPTARQDRNRRLITSLREDARSGDLWDMCAADAKLGRMTPPVFKLEAGTANVTLSPRFCIEQGVRFA